MDGKLSKWMRASMVAAALLCGGGHLLAGDQDHWAPVGEGIAPPSGRSFTGPVAVSATEVFVGLDNGEVGVFGAADGTYLRTIAGAAAGGRINGMVVDSAGRLRVLDLSIPAVLRREAANGAELDRFGVAGTGEGQLRQQSSTTRLLLGIDGADNLYVADPLARRVVVFAADGSFLRQWGQAGQLIGQFSHDPGALAVTSDGTVFISAGRLYKFTSDGTLLHHRNVNLNSLALLPEGLPLQATTLYSYDLSKTSAIPLNATAMGVAFTRDGTAWDPSSGQLERLRRKFAGTDEPAPGTPLKAVPQPRIIRVAQRAGTTLLDIDYEVIDADSPTVEVRVLAWQDGADTLDKLVIPTTWADGTGSNLGPDIPSNTPLRLTWDISADFTDPFGHFEIEILARDDHPPLPVHWITIPANAAAGTDEFEISKEPVSDAQLLGLLLWEVAAGGGGQWRFEQGGEIWYDGGAEPKPFWPKHLWHNWQDIEVLFSLLGYDVPTWAQVMVALELDYGISQVGAHSIVSLRTGQDPNPATFAIGDMVFVPAGPFGDFEIGRYAVTFGEWTTVRNWALNHGYTDLPEGRNWGSANHPVASVSWYDVVKWCNAKSEMEGLMPVYFTDEFAREVYRTGQVDLTDTMVRQNASGYRLPRVSEWEYAARGGPLRSEFSHAGSNDIDAVAWYSGNVSPQAAQAVGQKLPNSLWLYDMSGNVWDWCWDRSGATTTNRFIRGADFRTSSSNTVSTWNPRAPGSRWDTHGFRLARTPEP